MSLCVRFACRSLQSSLFGPMRMRHTGLTYSGLFEISFFLEYDTVIPISWCCGPGFSTLFLHPYFVKYKVMTVMILTTVWHLALGSTRALSSGNARSNCCRLRLPLSLRLWVNLHSRVESWLLALLLCLLLSSVSYVPWLCRSNGVPYNLSIKPPPLIHIQRAQATWLS